MPPKKIATPRHASIALGLLPQLLGYRLRLAQRAVFADFKRRVGDSEIGPGSFGILEIVDANPGMTQSALADALGLDRSSLVPALNRLEQRDLLSRESSPADRRRNGLHLTQAGKRHLRALRRQVKSHEARLAARLSTEEHRTLMALLAKLIAEPP